VATLERPLRERPAGWLAIVATRQNARRILPGVETPGYPQCRYAGFPGYPAYYGLASLMAGIVAYCLSDEKPSLNLIHVNALAKAWPLIPASA